MYVYKHILYNDMRYFNTVRTALLYRCTIFCYRIYCVGCKAKCIAYK